MRMKNIGVEFVIYGGGGEDEFVLEGMGYKGNELKYNIFILGKVIWGNWYLKNFRLFLFNNNLE